MPITYTVSEDDGVLVKGEDPITGSEIKETNDAIYRSPESIVKIKYQLWDLVNVKEFLLSKKDIMAFAKQDAVAAKINPNMIIAIVASRDLIYGFSRMWEAYSYSSPFKSMTFRRIEDAERWIDEMLAHRSV